MNIFVLNSHNPRFQPWDRKALAAESYKLTQAETLEALLAEPELSEPHIILAEIATPGDVSRARFLFEWKEDYFRAGRAKLILLIGTNQKDIVKNSRAVGANEIIQLPILTRSLLFKLSLQKQLINSAIAPPAKKEHRAFFSLERVSVKSQKKIILLRGPSPEYGTWNGHPKTPQGKVRWRWIASETKGVVDADPDYKPQWEIDSSSQPIYDSAEHSWLVEDLEAELRCKVDEEILFSSKKFTEFLKLKEDAQVQYIEASKANALTFNELQTSTEVHREEAPSSLQNEGNRKEVEPYGFSEGGAEALPGRKSKEDAALEASLSEKVNEQITLNSISQESAPKIYGSNEPDFNAGFSNKLEEAEKVLKKDPSFFSSTEAQANGGKKLDAPVKFETKEQYSPLRKNSSVSDDFNNFLISPTELAKPFLGKIKPENFKANNNSAPAKEMPNFEMNTSGLEAAPSATEKSDISAATFEREKEGPANIEESGEKDEASELRHKLKPLTKQLKGVVDKLGKSKEEEIGSDLDNKSADNVAAKIDSSESTPIITQDPSPQHKKKSSEMSSAQIIRNAADSPHLETFRNSITSGGENSGKEIRSKQAKESQSRDENAKPELSKETKPLKEAKELTSFHRQFFIKSLAELSDNNSSWERAGDYRVYLSADLKYKGLSKVALEFPVWIYLGELAPQFLEEEKGWKFYDRNPEAHDRMESVPLVVQEYIHELGHQAEKVGDAYRAPKRIKKPKDDSAVLLLTRPEHSERSSPKILESSPWQKLITTLKRFFKL